MSKKPPTRNKLPLQRGYLYFEDGKGGIIKPKLKRDKREPTDEELLAFFRACESAKPFRAGAMHYVRVRETHGVGAPVTDDAELNAYKQALALVEEVQRKMRSM
jgi:hypothetical protein